VRKQKLQIIMHLTKAKT